METQRAGTSFTHIGVASCSVTEGSDLKKGVELVTNKLRMLRVRLCSEGPTGEAEVVLDCVLGKGLAANTRCTE